MNLRDWRDRPVVAEFGPACWQSRALAVLAAIFVRPVLALLTVIGIAINRFVPRLLPRARLDMLDKPLGLLRPLPDSDVSSVTLSHCRAEWVAGPGTRGSARVLIYFPGSALVTPGLNSHRRFVSRLSMITRAGVLNVGYRLAPLSGIEDAVSDGLDAYRQVLAMGYPPDRIVLAGDSVGALVAVNTAVAARDAGLPTPAGQVLLSPLISGGPRPEHRAGKRRRDVMVPRMTVKFACRMFAATDGVRELTLMPPEADLRGLGPFLLQVGTDELLLDDTFALADRLATSKVPTWIQVWHKAMHMFQLSFDINPDADRAIDEISDFVHYVTALRNEASA